MADGGCSRRRVIGKGGDTRQPQVIRSHTGTEAKPAQPQTPCLIMPPTLLDTAVFLMASFYITHYPDLCLFNSLPKG